MELNFEGKTAMVAGGSRGLGYSIAHRLAKEGASVSIAARRDDVHLAARRIEQETGAQAFSCRVDLRETDGIALWADQTLSQFGGIDLLCVNSGGPQPGTFIELDDQAWQQAFELLLLGAIRQVRSALPSMRARGGGSIVLLTSSAVKEPIANLTLSNVVRASVAALSKSLALELAADHIRVNQLIPGRILTERVEQMDHVNAGRLGIPVEEQQKRSKAMMPLGRYGEPDEFARAAAFLLSDAASYVTGASLQVDGGLIRSVM